MYVGRLVWNRLRYLKDPDNGKRVSRLNPESEWVIQEVPELRIVEQDLWDAVKARQAETTFSQPARGNEALSERRRPRHLFAGLIRCGCCGGGYSMISKDLLGCSTARNKGTCDNRLNIRRDALEASVLSGLRTHLMEPDLFREFCNEFTREVTWRQSCSLPHTRKTPRSIRTVAFLMRSYRKYRWLRGQDWLSNCSNRKLRAKRD